ncbi:MAG: hypothetical protein HWN67_14750 [Candidatus Helarchaeota archaeon]|nr:hypothetical protein [Candidatus Helarchaeota archaeon]
MVERYRLFNWISIGLITGAMIFAILTLTYLLIYQENMKYQLPIIISISVKHID